MKNLSVIQSMFNKNNVKTLILLNIYKITCVWVAVYVIKPNIYGCLDNNIKKEPFMIHDSCLNYLSIKIL